MPITQFADLADLLLDNYGAQIVSALTQYGPGNSFIRDNSIIGRLAAKGRIIIASGEASDRYAAEWAVHTSTASASSFDAGDPYPAATTESVARAKLDWKRVGIPLEVDNLTLVAKNGLRGGGSIIAFEFESKIKSLIDEIEKQLAKDGTGNSNKDITGFKAFLSTSNTYAGISQSANAYWRAVVNDAAGAALAKSNLQAVSKALFDRGAIGPNSEIWMGSAQWQKFAALYTTMLRAAPGGEASDRIIPRYADGIVDLPIYVIPSLPTDEIWFVNLDRISLHFLDHTPAHNVSQAPRDQSVNREGIPFGIEVIETTRDTKALFIKAYTQLVCKSPREQGAIINLA